VESLSREQTAADIASQQATTCRIGGVKGPQQTIELTGLSGRPLHRLLQVSRGREGKRHEEQVEVKGLTYTE
jgi:hypothetical protein